MQDRKEKIIKTGYNFDKQTPDYIFEELGNLERDENIHILPADKGRNTVIWNTTDYDREAIRQLEDESTYQKLPEPQYLKQLEELSTRCNELAHQLYNNGQMTAREMGAVRRSPATGSAIYFLPKSHKILNRTTKTFYGRPVVATHSAKTHILDKYITKTTGPLLQRIPGSLKDTGDLLKRLPRKGDRDHSKVLVVQNAAAVLFYAD